MRSNGREDVIQFRVALTLKRYKFGSNIAARYLGKPRGLVQSWMQSGESHALAEYKFNLGAFEKKLRKVRQRVTKENIHYLLAMKLLDLDLPPEYVGRNLGVPTSTVRSWKDGVVPKGLKRVFIDRTLINREFGKLFKFLKYKSTNDNLPYFLSIKLSETARQKVGRRRIGGKNISTILTKHFFLSTPIPKETITCWIDGRRKPKEMFEVLRDNELINSEYRKIVNELTHEHMDYHLAKALHDKYNWKCSRISKILGLDKEKVRGWVTKDRGSPIAKCIKNEALINEVLKRYVDDEFPVENLEDEQEFQTEKNPNEINENDEDDYDSELEDEILYHLSYFPSGISSPKAIKSILIENKDAEINEIERVLNISPGILRRNGKWFLAS